MAEPEAVFALRLRLERALADHADMYQQVEVGKRERMLANAEIEGIKKYHFNEMHDLQDQLLAQRSAVSKLTMRLQEAMQGGHQAAMLQDEIATMKQSHSLSIKRTQLQAADQESDLRGLKAERDHQASDLRKLRVESDALAAQVANQASDLGTLRAERDTLAVQVGNQQLDLRDLTVNRDALAAQLQDTQACLDNAVRHTERQGPQQQPHNSHMEERYSVQLQELQVAHEKQLRAVQQAAHEVQADMQALHAYESRIMQEAHAADMMRLQELQEALPRQLAQAQSEARHTQDLSPSEIDAMLAQRGEVAISSDELHELRTLAANGADSAELAQETADLIALLHQARSSNATLRKERDRLRYKMDMFKKTLSSELVTMQLRGSNGPGSG